MSFVAIIVVSSKPEVILLPKCRYNSPKHCAAPINLNQTLITQDNSKDLKATKEEKLLRI